LKTALRNQVVFGLSSLQAQSQLLETKELTFEKAVQVTMTMDLSEQDSQQLQTETTVMEYVDAKVINQKAESHEKRNPIQESRAKRKTSKSERKLKKASVGKNNIRRVRLHMLMYLVLDGVQNHLANKCTLDKNIKYNYCGTPGIYAKSVWERSRHL